MTSFACRFIVRWQIIHVIANVDNVVGTPVYERKTHSGHRNNLDPDKSKNWKKINQWKFHIPIKRFLTQFFVNSG